MNPLLVTWMVLAEGARAEQFVKGFREGNLQRAANYDALLVAVSALAIAVAFYVVERFRRSRQAGPPCSDRRLFHDLCRLHRLNSAGRRLLERLARQAQLASAAEAFVRPDLFEASSSRTARERELLAQLKQSLFAG